MFPWFVSHITLYGTPLQSKYVVPLYIGHSCETDEHEGDAPDEVVLLAYGVGVGTEVPVRDTEVDNR